MAQAGVLHGYGDHSVSSHHSLVHHDTHYAAPIAHYAAPVAHYAAPAAIVAAPAHYDAYSGHHDEYVNISK